MRRGDFLVYLLLAVVWGLSFLVMLKVVEAFGWAGAVTFRALVAAGALMAVAAAIGRRMDFSAGWQRFAVVGATTVAIQLAGLCYGMPLTGTAMAAILVATIPLFSMVIGHLWGLERITGRGAVGLILGLVGIALLVGFPAMPVTPAFLAGCAASLVAAISAAFGSNYASRYLSHAGSWEVTAGSFLTGGLMTLPLLIAVPVPTAPRAVDFLYLLILGCIMSALAYALYFRLVSRIGPTKAISVEFVVTIVAVFIGALVLREPLSVMQLIGAAIVVTGCALVLGLFPGGRQRGQSDSPPRLAADRGIA